MICPFWAANTHILGNFQISMMIFKKFHDILKQEGQVALNRSPEFCIKLKYRNRLKADHAPGDTWGGAILSPRGII